MKCKQCGKPMKVRLSQTDRIVNGNSVHIINIPAFYCASCNRDFFHEIVLKKAEFYAASSQTAPVDYKEYEEKEEEDSLAHGLL